MVPWKNLHEVRDILDVLHGHVNHIYAEKKKAFANGDEQFFSQQPGHGKDVISTLSEYCFADRLGSDKLTPSPQSVKANKNDIGKEGISDTEVAGHVRPLPYI